ncbi:MAG: hypothetical protein BM562_10555 [Alphaproteobacteria bacterium MedPE-SWcel]|nr:MAG: hypothetical protein BM562_10555 [Alphaproteobacteria bacterium MedPE-SWcel]
MPRRQTPTPPSTELPADRLCAASQPRAMDLVARLGSVALLCALALTACTRVPQLEDRLPKDLQGQPYPRLLPLGTALAAGPLPEEESAALAETLETRAARLRRRAEDLRRRTP